ncbi:hypothetical protein [Nitrososphaera sp.]|uniref:hypothetical protein n=1 Tax=Nitrososphaera sp. TaxID=1971748 RepID=UPI002ED8DE92
MALKKIAKSAVAYRLLYTVVMRNIAVVTERQAEFRAKVAGIKDFDEAFGMVKSAVFEKFKMHRAGLSLILQVMPTNLGAYHILGSNVIVMNSYVLAAIRQLSGCDKEYNAYLFMVLAHEYLHSLGLVDENTVRQMTYEMCKEILGEDHGSTKMAKEDPSSLFPQLRSMVQTQFGREFHVIKDFDKAGQSYIQ